jgi:hypothetical protein
MHGIYYACPSVRKEAKVREREKLTDSWVKDDVSSAEVI